MKSLGKRADGLRLERMRASPLWNGTAFQNRHPILEGLRDASVPRPTLADFLYGGTRRVPQRALPSIDPRAAWAHKPGSGLRATWLGHSTVLLEMDGLRILTDPVWGPRASPTRWAGPKRFQPVPLSLRALPPIDLVLISHDHYDHLDYPSIRELAKRDVPFVTSLGVGAHLQSWGVPAERIHELDWWESYRLPGADLLVTAAPSQHFSGRTLKDGNATLWSSMALRSARHAVFFSGDTGLTNEYTLIRERLGPFDLALLEIGAFHPAWGHIHLGSANALKALDLLGGCALLPIHWGTFSLSTHAWDEPVETLVQLAPKHEAQLLLPRLGEAIEPAHFEGITPWWRGLDDQKQRSATLPAQAIVKALPKTMPWPVD